MKIQLKEDIKEFKAGTIVKALPAHNLPRHNRAIAGYWLQEGKDVNGVKWKNHPVGALVPFNSAEVVEISEKENAFEEREDALEWLHSRLKPGDTVYTIVTKVAKSGMSRNIQCFIPCYDAGIKFIANITWAVAWATGYRIKDGELIVGGGGMDMCFATVYALGGAMYGRGERCESFKHPSRRRAWNGEEGEKFENDGGYMLGQSHL